MNLRYFPMFSAVSAVVAVGTMLSPPTIRAQSSQAADVQILTRGPVHEAFAETVSFDPRPGLIVRAEVPNPIEELPPEQQLEGDNVSWIPGYWAWDDERNDFLWISGIWRNLPPGRQWIPGYWSSIGDGQSQWTSGYWADSTTSEVTYLATLPPRNIDTGPNIAASSDDQNWIPGNWVWNENRYAWRPGYWMALRTNWTWVPSRYNWNRRGYVYVDGYWDYAAACRGVLFAPVYFNRHLYDSPDYYYTPSIAIGLSVFADHLFVRPGCGHYYFGDYYDSRYGDQGYYASYAWNNNYRGYDPIFAYQRWNHRSDAGWMDRRRGDFDFFRNHEDVRPQHTWDGMQASSRNHYNDGRNRMFASPIDSIASTPGEGQRFRTLDQGRREQIVSQGRQVRNFGQERSQLETRGSNAGTEPNTSVARETLARSPITGRQAEKFASHEAPPQRPEARGPSIRVNPATSQRTQVGAARTGETRNLAGSQGSASGRVGERGAALSPTQTRPDRTASLATTNRPGRDGSVPRQAPGRPTDLTKARSQPGTAQPAAGASTGSTRQLQSQLTPQRPSQSQAQTRPTTPQRQTQATPQSQIRQATPQRQTQATPQSQVRQATPQRQTQATPQRQTQAQPQIRQAAPQRQATPQPQIRQATPQPQIRQAPPQRQATPQPQIRQAAPQRQAPPQPQIRQAAPQRTFQAPPQRQVQAQPQARQAPPQRQVQAQPQARQAPPQRQVQAQPQARQAPPQPQAPPPQARQAPPQRQVQAAPSGQPAAADPRDIRGTRSRH